MQYLIDIRKWFHSRPELSHLEKGTKEKIKSLMNEFMVFECFEAEQSHALFYLFDTRQEGPVVLFRADMDALPIQEMNQTEHASKNPGVSHACGHDGHTSILIGLAGRIGENRPRTGKIILLFQPAEETGEGAEKTINDPVYKSLPKPDYVFALHNLPGYPENQIIYREGTFCAGSVGVIISLEGATSHAAEPEKGRNPAQCMAELMQSFQNLPTLAFTKDFAICTIIHAILGEIAFGTSPGSAKIMLTIRAYQEEDLKKMREKVEEMVRTAAEKHQLNHSISYTEKFSVTSNHPEAIKTLTKAAEKVGLNMQEIDKPNRWSEDFGLFTQFHKGALFGLGAGENHPQLHSQFFDFNDNILEKGIEIFEALYSELCN